jgi:putative membrane protein
VYSYGTNLGPKVLDVPLLIGFNWAVLVFISGAITNRISTSIWIKSILGGGFMILLDLPMEVLAPTFDFWTFQAEAPLENYVSWFLIGTVMQFTFQSFKIKGNFTFSINLLLAQFVFFGVLAWLL